MSPARIALRGLRTRWVSSLITAGALAVSACLLMLVWAFKGEAERTFAAADGGFDAVLGPRGSKLQLVLNAIYHLEEPQGLVRQEDYERIRDHPAVMAAYPIALGDNYRGYRLVGALSAYLEDHEYRPGSGFALQGAGRVFREGAHEAVAGSVAARQLGLGIGDTFHPYHGLQYEPAARHEEIYTVVGVLEPTGTPADRVIWIPLEGVQTMSGHDSALATHLSAVLVKLRPGAAMAGFQLDMLYNKRGDRLTFAWPVSRVVLQLFEKLGWFDNLLRAIAVMVAVVAGAGVAAALRNAMDGRRRDIAVWRALGARRRTVFGIALMESIGIAASGLLAGFVLYAGVGYALAGWAQRQAGVAFDLFAYNDAFLWTPAGILAIGLLAGLVPAARAYATDVAKHLR